MQLGCLESVANSSVAYSSSSPLTYPAPTGTEFASPYFSANHQYTPLHHQSFHYEFQHSHPAVAPEAYGLNSLHSGQYYQQLHHGEPADFINLHSARTALKSSCLDEQQRRELGCLDAYRRHDLSLMTSHGSQAYGVGVHHPDQRLLPGAGLGLTGAASDDLQVYPNWISRGARPAGTHTNTHTRRLISLHYNTTNVAPLPPRSAQAWSHYCHFRFQVRPAPHQHALSVQR